MTKTKYTIAVSALAVVVVAVVIYLVTRPSKEAGSDKQIAYRLKWLANTGFAGDLVADTYGYFREEGLDVTVRPGGPEKDPIREVITGDAKFGVASADQVIRAIEQGAQIKVVAQIYQHDPVAWIYRSSNLSRPASQRI